MRSVAVTITRLAAQAGPPTPAWLFLISAAFTLAKTLRDRHEADLADARLQGRREAQARVE